MDHMFKLLKKLFLANLLGTLKNTSNNILKNTLSLGLIITCLTVGLMLPAAAKADFINDLEPFIGAEFYQVYMRGERNYSKIFPHASPGATIYLGTKLHRCLGIEIGYDWSSRVKRRWGLPGGTLFFNSAVRAGGISGTTKIRRSGGHFDFLGYLPITDCFELFGSIGYGWVQARIHTILNVPAGNNTMASVISTLTDRGRSVARVGLGASIMLNDYVGLRAKIGWETTSRLRIKGNQNFTPLGFSTKGWKDSVTGSIGTFVKF